ncbi:MAG: general secretion pathway protein GspF [Gammaproteobacteria bacterium]|nr:general secretion pathway protein GspF [Gammaproteobacteria bacterium]
MTMSEYLSLVDQAIFELEELRFSAEYDSEELGQAFSFLDTIEAQMRKLREQIVNGEYRFGTEDLPFMALAEKQDEYLLPFKSLLRTINYTHRTGLDTGHG